MGNQTSSIIGWKKASSVAQALAETPFFAHLSIDELTRLSSLAIVRVYEHGHVIATATDLAHDAFIVMNGQADIIANDSIAHQSRLSLGGAAPEPKKKLDRLSASSRLGFGGRTASESKPLTRSLSTVSSGQSTVLRSIAQFGFCGFEPLAQFDKLSEVSLVSKAAGTEIIRLAFDPKLPKEVKDLLGTIRAAAQALANGPKVLRGIRGLADLAPSRLRSVMSLARPVVLQPGQVMCRIGEASDSMAVVVQGELQVVSARAVPRTRPKQPCNVAWRDAVALLQHSTTPDSAASAMQSDQLDRLLRTSGKGWVSVQELQPARKKTVHRYCVLSCGKLRLLDGKAARIDGTKRRMSAPNIEVGQAKKIVAPRVLRGVASTAAAPAAAAAASACSAAAAVAASPDSSSPRAVEDPEAIDMQPAAGSSGSASNPLSFLPHSFVIGVQLPSAPTPIRPVRHRAGDLAVGSLLAPARGKRTSIAEIENIWRESAQQFGEQGYHLLPHGCPLYATALCGHDAAADAAPQSPPDVPAVTPQSMCSACEAALADESHVWAMEELRAGVALEETGMVGPTSDSGTAKSAAHLATRTAKQWRKHWHSLIGEEYAAGTRRCVREFVVLGAEAIEGSFTVQVQCRHDTVLLLHCDCKRQQAEWIRAIAACVHKMRTELPTSIWADPEHGNMPEALLGPALAGEAYPEGASEDEADVQATVATLRQGSMMGEVSLCAAAQRTATCIATQQTVLLEFQRARFEQLRGSVPGMEQTARTLLKNRCAANLNAMQLPFLQGWKTSMLEALVRNGKLHICSAGQAVCKAGDPGGSLFVVLSGLLEVAIPCDEGEAPGLASATLLGRGWKSVNLLRVGSYFGELSLLTGNPRAATVSAREESVLIEVSAAGLMQLFTAPPERTPTQRAALSACTVHVRTSPGWQAAISSSDMGKVGVGAAGRPGVPAFRAVFTLMQQLLDGVSDDGAAMDDAVRLSITDEVLAVSASACASLADFELRIVQGAAELKHVLQHALGLPAFHAAMEAEFSSENIKFWHAAQEFKQSWLQVLRSFPPLVTQCIADAMQEDLDERAAQQGAAGTGRSRTSRRAMRAMPITALMPLDLLARCEQRLCGHVHGADVAVLACLVYHQALHLRQLMSQFVDSSAAQQVNLPAGVRSALQQFMEAVDARAAAIASWLYAGSDVADAQQDAVANGTLGVAPLEHVPAAFQALAPRAAALQYMQLVTAFVQQTCVLQPAQREIYELMHKDNYARFKKSAAFVELMRRIGCYNVA